MDSTELTRTVTRLMHVACESGVADGPFRDEWLSLVERTRELLASTSPAPAVAEAQAVAQPQPSDEALPKVIDQRLSLWLTLGKELHPLTVNLVVRFARALAAKLADAEVKYGYSDGWRDADWMDECRAKLLEHVAKGDPRDVAAYCAFLWHHGERTAIPAPAAPAALDFESAATSARNDVEAARACKGSSMAMVAACLEYVAAGMAMIRMYAGGPLAKASRCISAEQELVDNLVAQRIVVRPDAPQSAAPAAQRGEEPCPNAAHMGEHACTNRQQCWEPCGELGHSAEHAVRGTDAGLANRIRASLSAAPAAQRGEELEAERNAARYLRLRNASMEDRNRFEHYAGAALDAILDASLVPQEAAPRKLICPKCGVDKFTTTCPGPIMDCPMLAKALTAQEAAPLTDEREAARAQAIEEAARIAESHFIPGHTVAGPGFAAKCAASIRALADRASLSRAPVQQAEPMTEDTERLDWVTRAVSGKALRDVGVVWPAWSPEAVRAAIDRARAASTSRTTGEGE